MADVVVVGVLEAKVVLLDDVHLVVHLLHQLLPRRFLLQRKQMSIQATNKSLKKVRWDEIDHEVKGRMWWLVERRTSMKVKRRQNYG